MIMNSQIDRNAVSMRGLASVPGGDACLITDTEYMDTRDTKYTSRQQLGLTVCSGRRRGRPRGRGRGSRGCSRSGNARRVLQRTRELEQSPEDGSILKVGLFRCNDYNE